MIVGLAIAKFLQPGELRAVVGGLVLVATGAVGAAVGMVRYRRVNRELEAGRFVTGAGSATPLWAGGILLVVLLVTCLLVLL
jgi:putative membrane protein